MASVVVLGLLACTVIVLRDEWGGPLAAVAIGGWAGLAAWQGVSAAWAYEPAAATNAMNLTVLYGSSFALVLIALRRREWLRRVSDGALLVSGVTAAYAVSARLLPALVGGDEEARLSTPITYWNGLGVMLAFGAVLALGTAGHAGRPLLVRGAAGALVPLFLLGMLFTLSRGAALALAVGLVVLLAVAPGRLETAAALAVTGAASFPLLKVANAERALTAYGSPLPPHEAEGRRVAFLLVATILVAAVAAVVMAIVTRRLPARERRFAGATVLAAAAVAALLLVAANPPEGGIPTWLTDQFEAFRRGNSAQATAKATSISDRLFYASGTGRWQHWEVAVEQFKSAPVPGSGSGDYRFWWLAERPFDVFVRNAHSLYLEVLGESGLVGLALLLVPALAGLFGIGRALASRPPPSFPRPLVVALAGCSTVGLDLAGAWDWQLPAAFLPALALRQAALRAAVL